MKIHIEGYGTVKVKIPKHRTRAAVENTVGRAIAKTMQLVVRRPDHFHPALGWGER